MADNNSDQEKTEEPTQKKLEESRKRGQVAVSREVNNWLMLFASSLIVIALSYPIFRNLANLMKNYFEKAHDIRATPQGLHLALVQPVYDVFGILIVPLILLVIAAVAGPLLQVGPLFAPESIKPELSKISPKKGLGRLFSMRSVVEFLKGILKISLIGATAFIIVSPYYKSIDKIVGQPMQLVLNDLHSLITNMLIGVLVVLIILAVIDLVYQRQANHKQMMMTKQEVKDEMKQREGDPHVKGRLRQLRHEKARQRMMQNVPQADVVITNPTHFAIALKYDPDLMDAPICIAKGMDDLALRIKELAKEKRISIVENKPLARALFDTVEVDQMIPEDHYKAVAEIISFVFRQKGKIPS